ncbi:MAG: hypothetical protein AB1762_19105 [Gemmatimonadota bacterium]
MTEQETVAASPWTWDLPAFAELIASLSDVDDVPDERAVRDSMELDAVTLSLAIELEVRDADGPSPRVTGSTPTQWTETSVLPVFHRLSLHVARVVDA